MASPAGVSVQGLHGVWATFLSFRYEVGHCLSCRSCDGSLDKVDQKNVRACLLTFYGSLSVICLGETKSCLMKDRIVLKRFWS